MTEFPIYYKVITHPNFAQLHTYQNGAMVEVYITTKKNKLIKGFIAKGVFHNKIVLDELFQTFYEQLEIHSRG